MVGITRSKVILFAALSTVIFHYSFIFILYEHCNLRSALFVRTADAGFNRTHEAMIQAQSDNPRTTSAAKLSIAACDGGFTETST